MTRTLNSSTDERRHEVAYLYQLTYSNGTLYLTNSSYDISALSQTWQATGGRLLHDAVSETTDRRAQGLTLKLYGVDQTIISTILSNSFRGQPAKVYMVHFNPDTGVAETPDLIWAGLQNGDYKINETRDTNDDMGGKVEVEVRIVSRLALIARPQPVRSSVVSHQAMLDRKSLTATDTFFSRVPGLHATDIYWGTEGSSGFRAGIGRVRRPPPTRFQ